LCRPHRVEAAEIDCLGKASATRRPIPGHETWAVPEPRKLFGEVANAKLSVGNEAHAILVHFKGSTTISSLAISGSSYSDARKAARARSMHRAQESAPALG
jgi:hypothetical protein